MLSKVLWPPERTNVYEAPQGEEAPSAEVPPQPPATRQVHRPEGSCCIVQFSVSIGTVMADNPAPQTGNALPFAVSDAPHAPFIFFEVAPSFGFTNGVVNITLSANRSYVGKDGTIINEQVVTAYLRGNVLAARSLKQAIDSALLLAAPTGEGKSN